MNSHNTGLVWEIVRRKGKYHKIEALTKDVDSKLSIDWRKKSIHEMNEPPCYVEGDCNWKKNDTSKKKKKTYQLIKHDILTKNS